MTPWLWRPAIWASRWAPLLSGLLAAELKRRMPNQLDYVLLNNSGAEGVETALKYARCATGKPAILHCKGQSKDGDEPKALATPPPTANAGADKR
jgi:hypothetical protein